MNRSKLSFLVAGLIFSSVFVINRIYKTFNNTSKSLSQEKLSRNELKFPNPQNQKMQRIRIFEDTEVFTNKFNPLFSYKQKGGKVEGEILEQYIKPSLGSLLREELQKIFFKKGWNFQELSGKVYYEIIGSSIEVQVFWKKSIFEKTYSAFDRFEIRL